MVVVQKRQRIIDETDRNDDEDVREDIEDVPKTGPSTEALAKLTDYREWLQKNHVPRLLTTRKISYPIYQRRAGDGRSRSAIEASFPTGKVLAEKRGYVRSAYTGEYRV